jgi:hypothetical protein
MTPAHHGKSDKVPHLGSGGTLRSGPKQFAVGNLDKGGQRVSNGAPLLEQCPIVCDTARHSTAAK